MNASKPNDGTIISCIKKWPNQEAGFLTWFLTCEHIYEQLVHIGQLSAICIYLTWSGPGYLCAMLLSIVQMSWKYTPDADWHSQTLGSHIIVSRNLRSLQWIRYHRLSNIRSTQKKQFGIRTFYSTQEAAPA